MRADTMFDSIPGMLSPVMGGYFLPKRSPTWSAMAERVFASTSWMDRIMRWSSGIRVLIIDSTFRVPEIVPRMTPILLPAVSLSFMRACSRAWPAASRPNNWARSMYVMAEGGILKVFGSRIKSSTMPFFIMGRRKPEFSSSSA